MLRLVQCMPRLSKLRLSGLVATTTGFGFLAAGSPLDGVALAAAVGGTLLTACSAGAFNQIIEIASDAKMKRTRSRPLPSGRINVKQASLFGAVTGGAGLAVLCAGTNPLTAALGLANLVFYTNVYTPLKKITPWNTEIGAIVGAIPPVMGWTAATGCLFAPEVVALSSILFLWQMPHFLSLAWILRHDYRSGGYRMLSLNDADGKTTARASLIYTGMLFLLPVATTAAGMTNGMFVAHGLAANSFILYNAFQFYSAPSDASARSLFRSSLWHLPLLMALFAYHKLNRQKEAALKEIDDLHTFGKRLCIHEGVATTAGKCIETLETTDKEANTLSSIY